MSTKCNILPAVCIILFLLLTLQAHCKAHSDKSTTDKSTTDGLIKQSRKLIYVNLCHKRQCKSAEEGVHSCFCCPHLDECWSAPFGVDYCNDECQIDL